MTPRSSPEARPSDARRIRVLGVDPGSRTTGWGLLGGTFARPRLLGCGVLRLDAASDFPSRLALLQRNFIRLLSELRPASAAVESPFHGKNSHSALQLAHARGVILATLAGAGVSVAEYTPATVKKAVTGNGRAPKEQVRRMVCRFLGSLGSPAGSDRSDALAVALCHAATHGQRSAIERAALRDRRGDRPRRGAGGPVA